MRIFSNRHVYNSFLILFFLIYGYFLFKNLGQYHFWDDEANTAIYARNLLKTGELNAFDGRNLIGYSNGIELDENLNNVIIPPFQYYLVASSFWLLGDGTFAARFPFALMGLLAFVVFFLINKELFKERNLILVNMLIFATNIGFILYMRQSRYYAPTALFFLTNIWLLIRYYKIQNWKILPFYTLSTFLLFVSQYNAGLAIASVLALVYWYLKKWSLKDPEVKAFIAANAITVIFIAIYLFFNNPFDNTQTYSKKGFDFAYKLYVFYKSILALDTFAFLSVPLVAAFMYFNKRQLGSNPKVLKLLLWFLVINMVGFAFFSLKYAVRYIVYMIPIALLIEGYIIYQIWHWPVRYARVLSTSASVLLIFTSMLFISTGSEANVSVGPININSHFIDYIDEIHKENPTSYSEIIEYLKDENERNKTVLVLPVYMSCPLMYYVGNQYLFVNQIPKKKEIRNDLENKLPDHVFNYEVAPDYIIICGPDIEKKDSIFENYQETAYKLDKHIDFYYRDVTRPEYEWRNFDVENDYNRKTETIFIFKKIS